MLSRCCMDSGAIEVIGLCDPSKININAIRSWTEISIPEVETVPATKPDIETIDKVFISVKIISKRVIATPAGTGNLEGTILTNRKLIIEGILCQKIVYTAALPTQPVHSMHINVPFSAFIVLPAGTSLEAEFCVEPCVEDVFVKAFNGREVFKNVTLFLQATPLTV